MDQIVSPPSNDNLDSFVDLKSGVIPTAFKIYFPKIQTIPIVFSSPHSGRIYPQSFINSSRLDPLTLRRSEDCFVDEIFLEAPNFGAPFLTAILPRAYIDLNREPYELDQEMFDDQLPGFVKTKSPKIFAGLGTIPKIVANGENIYQEKLRFLEAKHRINKIYFPYHRALKRLIENTRKKFGTCILIDCHSMPSFEDSIDINMQKKRVDFELGNNNGTSSSPELLLTVKASLEKQQKLISSNQLYCGGYSTCHYGDPDQNIHSLQIEINRMLYMDEKEIRKHSGFDELLQNIKQLISDLSQFNIK